MPIYTLYVYILYQYIYGYTCFLWLYKYIWLYMVYMVIYGFIWLYMVIIGYIWLYNVYIMLYISVCVYDHMTNHLIDLDYCNVLENVVDTIGGNKKNWDVYQP